MSTVALPPLIALRSNVNGKYVHFRDELDSQTHGFLQSTGETVVSPYAKFEVVRATIGRGLVHIRACYNNKYLRRRDAATSWIVAAANEPEEEQSRWSCTLFEPVLHAAGNPLRVRFLHVQLRQYAVIHRDRANTPYELCMSAYTDQPQSIIPLDVFAVTDWETLLILPKNVSFKGDNGHYLSLQQHNHISYLQSIPIEKGNTRMWFQISTDGHGRVQIMSYDNKLRWDRENSSFSRIHGGHINSGTNFGALFVPIKISDNRIALRNMGNNLLCQREDTVRGVNDCLCATAATTTARASLLLEEHILGREIYDCNFRLMDARIYNERIVSMVTQNAVNQTTENNTQVLRFAYKESKSGTWNTVISATAGYSSTFKTGIPFLAQASISISAEVTAQHQWGETFTEEKEVESTYTTIVPPMTDVTVRMVATEGAYDVPFSYYQRDRLYDGTTVIYYKNDGLYTGINSFNFRYETEERPLRSFEIQELNLLPSATEEPNQLQGSERLTDDPLVYIIEESSEVAKLAI